MKKIYNTITCLLFIGILLPSNILVFGDKTEAIYSQATDTELHVSLNIGSIELGQRNIGGEEFVELTVDGAHKSQVIGAPALPMVNSLIEIPYGAEPRIEIIAKSFIDYNLDEIGLAGRIYPTQESVSKSQEQSSVTFYLDEEIYSQNSFTSESIATINDVGTMRALRIGNLMISPIQYNPSQAQLRVYDRIDLIVHFDGANLTKTNQQKKIYYSPYFESIYNQISNYNPNTRFDDMINDPVTYVIITSPIFLNSLNNFIDWKTQKGFNVVIGNTAEIGSSTSAIKNFIEDLYDNPSDGMTAPSFVLFVGDVAQVPSYNGTTGSHVTDLYYVDMTGDMIQDIFHGRFSANNLSQLNAQISKTLEYEKYEMPDPSYLEEVLMVAGVDASYASTYGNGQINYGNDYYFNSAHGISTHTYLYPASDAGGAAAAIIQDYSEGVGFANYTAHCSPAGWADPSFTTSDVSGLYNYNQYNLMIGNCCTSTAFDQESFGEAVLRAENKGAVGYIGGTNNTYWNEDYWWGVGNGNITANPSYNSTGPGAYDCSFHENGEENWAVVNSTVMLAGNLAVVEAGTSLVDYYLEIYHLMGDPSLSTYFGIPSTNSVYHDTFVPIGSESLTISALPHSYIGISMNGQILGSGTADESGTAEINLSNVSVPGTALVVVTGQNLQPHLSEILIASPDGPYVMVDNYSFTSGSVVDTDVIEFGETVNLTINLENVGNGDAVDTNLNLSTDDPYITITNGSSNFNLGSNNSFTSDGLEFIVDDNIPNNYSFQIACSISSGDEIWESMLNFTAFAPEIEVDSIIGNLEPGIPASLSINLWNLGGSDIHSPVVEIIGDSYVTVNSSSFSNAYVWMPGGMEVLDFNVSVSPNTPIGHLADFAVNIYSYQPPTTDYNGVVTFSLPVGQVISNFEDGFNSNIDWELACSGLGCESWGPSTDDANSGSSSAASGAIDNNQTSSMSVTLDVTADGEIDFFYRVSAEYSTSGNYFYDGLKFYIDGSLIGEYQTPTNGQSNWTNVNYPVSAGTRTFTWSYVKDGGGGSTDCINTDCEDRAYVDDITFPPAAVESDSVFGDLNGDMQVNILDAIVLVNVVLGQEDSYNADLNGDGVVNILDVVQIVNLILGNRGADATSATLIRNIDSMSISTDGYISAIEMTLDHGSDFSIDLSTDALVAEYVTDGNRTHLIIVAPESDELFSYSGSFDIADVQVASAAGLIDVAEPQALSIRSAYPNPFNPTTTVAFELPAESEVSVVVYDMVGREVAMLGSGMYSAGYHAVTWNADSFSSGIYFVRVADQVSSATQKLILIK